MTYLTTFLKEILATFGITSLKPFVKNNALEGIIGKKASCSVTLKKDSELMLIFGNDSIPGFMIERQLPSCGHFGHRGMICKRTHT